METVDATIQARIALLKQRRDNAVSTERWHGLVADMDSLDDSATSIGFAPVVPQITAAEPVASKPASLRSTAIVLGSSAVFCNYMPDTLQQIDDWCRPQDTGVINFTIEHAPNIDVAGIKNFVHVGSGMATSLLAICEHGAFDQITSIRLSQIIALVDGIGTTYKVPYQQPLKQRLKNLYEMWADEHPSGDGLVPESLSALLRFLTSERSIRMPTVTVSPNGTVVAEWRKDARNLFAAHFLSETRARFSLIRETPAGADFPIELWGSTEVSNLLPTAIANNARELILA